MLSQNIYEDSCLIVVDDDESNIFLVERLLARAGYTNVRATTSPIDALALAEAMHPDLIMLDLKMPVMDGFEMMQRLQDRIPPGGYLPILVFSGDSNPETRRRALEYGASDFLTKPGDNSEILLRVGNFLKTKHLHKQLEGYNKTLEEKVEERTADLENAQREILQRLALASDYRDDDTGEHTHRVGELAGKVARILGLPHDEVELIEDAAPLHDLGKIGIPDSILLKPGRLTPEEFDIMKTHAEIGAKLLDGGRSPLIMMAATIAISHHERWDGTGYPNGLAGEDIPLCGRITAVADVFDALTHERPYKSAMPVPEAIEEIRSQRGRQFDPNVVDAFLKVIGAEEDEQKLSIAA